MLALTLPTSGGHSVGIVLLRTKTTEYFFAVLIKCDSRDCNSVQHFNTTDISSVREVRKRRILKSVTLFFWDLRL
jgi:hypothetical protein